MVLLSEIENKLNAILDDPDAMAHLMDLAKQLSGSSTSPEKKESPAVNDGIDPQFTARFLPLLKELGRTNPPASQLLLALRPYLKTERRDKVERAIKLAHVIHIAKQFLAEGGLDDV